MKVFAIGLKLETMFVSRGAMYHGNRDCFFTAMHTTGMRFDL